MEAFLSRIAVAAISGAILCIETFESLLSFWYSYGCTISHPFLLMIGSALERSLAGVFDDMESEYDNKAIGTNTAVNISGDGYSCSICLEDFEVGELARCLPQCHHLFHRLCINQWLIKHNSCPLCRKLHQ